MKINIEALYETYRKPKHGMLKKVEKELFHYIMQIFINLTDIDVRNLGTNLWNTTL